MWVFYPRAYAAIELIQYILFSIEFAKAVCLV